MDPKFRDLVDSLHAKHVLLVEQEPASANPIPREMPDRGIYLFSEGPLWLYVGRTNRLRERIADHCRPSSSHNQATFAFRIARQATGKTKATYSTTGSRRDLSNDQEFQAAFSLAKERVRRMQLRFVGEDDPTRQALLEIYAATVLETPYNDFENH